MNDIPYIHVFRTSEQCYVYDVNTNKILRIPETVYHYLSNSGISDCDGTTLAFIQNMKANGFLRSDRVEISEHPATPLLSYYLENKMQQLMLQVTQNCNLRCNYCSYSGSYKNRTHSHSLMSDETAERAIDYFINRTKDNKSITVSFYGGEPLLNFELIKHCVDYIEARYSGKRIDYGMTTNGTLLDDNVIIFLVNKGFNLLISLDGPKEIHDAHRRFANSIEGSFSVIMENIKRIKNLYPEYYQSKVRFNAVLDITQMFSCVNEFVLDDEYFGEENKFMYNYVTNNYTDNRINIYEEFFVDREYEFFKLLLSKLGAFPRNKTSYILANQLSRIYLHCFQSIEIEEEHIPPKFHHSGPCIPGASRLFVDTTGKLFPCERVSEISETVVLGDIEKGICLKKATQILNLETTTHSKCRDCWAYRQCTICVALADDLKGVSDVETKKECPIVCASIEDIFKNYCVLRELGYTFDEERL